MQIWESKYNGEDELIREINKITRFLKRMKWFWLAFAAFNLGGSLAIINNIILQN